MWNPLSSRPSRKSRARPLDGIRIYAIGDIHGRADLLERLLARIRTDSAAKPTADPLLVFLGDYVDRGPNSREVLDLLIAWRRHHLTICLKGNHETLLLAALQHPATLHRWIRVGGVNTLLSYGIAPNINCNDWEQRELATALGRSFPDSHRRFISGLPISFTCGDFFFAHAGVRPGIPLAQQREEDLLWIRDDFLLHERNYGKIVVHGHTPVKHPETRSNRINIDTGAYATGSLTCLVLDRDGMRFI